MKSSLIVVIIVAIVAVASLMILSSANSGMLSLCTEGRVSVLEPIPGGGQQIICVGQAKATGGKFETYSAHPRGDYRRQTIAVFGYEALTE